MGAALSRTHYVCTQFRTSKDSKCHIEQSETFLWILRSLIATCSYERLQ